MDIIIENRKAGRLVFELFDDLVPLAADNFRSLCTGTVRVAKLQPGYTPRAHALCAGERGLGAVSYKPLTYKHNIFHKVIADQMVCYPTTCWCYNCSLTACSATRLGSAWLATSRAETGTAQTLCMASVPFRTRPSLGRPARCCFLSWFGCTHDGLLGSQL